MNVDQAISKLYQSLFPKEKLRKTIKTIGEIPENARTKGFPDLYGVVEVTFNEFEGSYCMEVDEAIYLWLKQKEKLTEEETKIFEFIDKHIEARLSAEQRAGESL